MGASEPVPSLSPQPTYSYEHEGDRQFATTLARGLEVLLVQEQKRQRAQPFALLAAEALQHRPSSDRGSPRIVGNRMAGQDAPPAPALEHPKTRTRRPTRAMPTPAISIAA